MSRPSDGTRPERFDRLTAERLDLLVAGGGILGTGIARDAALRGLRVGLVEQSDLAFGTSGRSSRLLHGGLRYLAQGRVLLVREASREKRILHRIAPHLADPLPFVFPTYRATRWPLWQLRAGVKLYDLLCGGKNLGPSRSFSAQALRDHLPGINPDRLTGGVRYFDGLTNDARLVIDTAASAAAGGAVVLNYARLEQALPAADVWDCDLLDVESGHTHRLLARAVVNATGPWAERFRHSAVRLRLTKGVHLVVDRDRLPVPDAVVMTQDDRILFAIPWGRRVILGTTDTDYDDSLDAVETDPADVDTVLGVANAAFPGAQLAENDVLGTWAGVRPLIFSGKGGPSDISRAHQIRMPQPGWFDVAGGKLTTYRLIAEQTVDRVLRYLGHRPVACRTATEPLLELGEAGEVCGILPPEPTAEQVAHFCEREWARHLDDVMIRRTSWHYYRADARQLAPQVARWMADALDWDEPRRQAELARYGKVAPRRPGDRTSDEPGPTE